MQKLSLRFLNVNGILSSKQNFKKLLKGILRNYDFDCILEFGFQDVIASSFQKANLSTDFKIKRDIDCFFLFLCFMFKNFIYFMINIFNLNLEKNCSVMKNKKILISLAKFIMSSMKNVE